MMMLHMLGMRIKDNKIGWVVIKLVSVYMMAIFALLNGSTKYAFKNNNMLKNITLSISTRMRKNKQFLVSFFYNKGFSFKQACAFMRTKSRQFPPRSFESLKTIPAIFAPIYFRNAWPIRCCRKAFFLVNKNSRIVSSAISFTKMNIITLFNGTISDCFLGFVLFRKTFSFLPLSITRVRTKGAFSYVARRIPFFTFCSAINTYSIFHDTHINIFNNECQHKKHDSSLIDVLPHYQWMI